MQKIRISILILVSSFACSLLAQNVTYYKPTYKNFRLDWCDTWTVNCGKPVADKYCHYKGHLDSVYFSKDENIGLTRLMGDDSVCQAGFCDGFKKITCKRKTILYMKPMWGGHRLDWCRDWASNCGKPAADLYCQKKGYSNAYSFSKDSDIGVMTRVITTGQVCQGSYCDGFKHIRCQ